MHKYTAKIIVRKDVPRFDGTCLICIQAFINGKRVVIPLDQHILPELLVTGRDGAFVSAHKSLPKKRRDDLNLELSNALAKASDIFTTHRLSDRMLTPEMFKAKYRNASLKNDFLDFWQKHIDKINKSIADCKLKNITPSYSEATVQIYEGCLNKIKLFRPHILFADLDLKFIHAYNHFLKGQGLHQNTIAKHHIRVKTFINLAINVEEVLMPNPYDKFPIKFNRTGRTYLDLSELFKLIQLYDKNVLLPYLQDLLCRFLFSCFSSLRWSDNKIIGEDNIWGNTLVIGQSRKTKNVLRIPLTAPGEKFLREIINKQIPVIELNHANEGLKTIAEAAGITKKLTTHVGRHTYATTFLKLGGKVEVLQKIMDHSKIETTMVYVHIVESDIKESAEMFDRFLKVA